ncbi:triosephosphate isomerase [bacterium BMS3Bbin14]|nr:triosephosphate isomerase [bacterium BMS3Abin13]GBE52704.1 triosephosphate isomerase [bacterium BMS3Bbin14]HDK43703.1 triosephosphate isomerase [Desulfobacteraceae bacterium]HDL98576.1 triosephosphate isomerase [Desulfobacteraceae bacterium]
MEKIVLANWKAHLSPAGAEEWLADFAKGYQPLPGLRVILAVPFLHLDRVRHQAARLDRVYLAAQDVSPYPPGSYTGATPAAWLAGLAEYVLIGHRERRRYFHETTQDAANKVNEAVAAGLRPILCMDRNEAGAQVAALDLAGLEQVVLAYTPADAVQLEVARSAGAIAGAAEYFSGLSGGRPVLYGGGVNADTVGDLIALPRLAGVMTAAGCLDPRHFIDLLVRAGEALGAAPK